MADSNIEVILTALSDAVAKVIPENLANYGFVQHQGSTALEEGDDTQGMRIFEWRDTGEFKVGAPAADSSSGWYTTTLELRIFYPKTLLIEGYSPGRGLPGLRLRDRVDLNKALMYSDPLSDLPASIEYNLLQLVGSSLNGKILSLFYRVSWKEDL